MSTIVFYILKDHQKRLPSILWVSKMIKFFQVCYLPFFVPLVLVANRGMRVPPVSREMHCRRRVECTSGAKLHCTMQWEDAQWGVALLKGWGVSVVLVHLGGRCITQWEDALREDMQWWDALHVTVRDTFEGREKIPIACDENHFEVGSILYLNLREWVELTRVWLAESGKLTLSKTAKKYTNLSSYLLHRYGVHIVEDWLRPSTIRLERCTLEMLWDRLRWVTCRAA